MRRSLTALFFTSALLAVAGCQPKKDLLALPAAYNPREADLTFNKKNLEAFNLMKEKEREAFVEELKGKAGSFRGQAVTEAGNGIAAGVDGSQHGAWETFAHVTDPVLYEITIDYRIFSTEELGRPIGRALPIAFSGTLVELRYDAQAKPRKLTIDVKADKLELITDKPSA